MTPRQMTCCRLRTRDEKSLETSCFEAFFTPHPQTPLRSLIPCGFPGVDYKRPDFINGIERQVTGQMPPVCVWQFFVKLLTCTASRLRNLHLCAGKLAAPDAWRRTVNNSGNDKPPEFTNR